MKCMWLTEADGQKLINLKEAAKRLIAAQGRADAWAFFTACVRDCGTITIYHGSVVIETSGPMEEL